MLRHRLHLDRVPEVRLVGAVFAHGLAIRNAREDRRDALAVGEGVEDAADHRLHGGEHVVLRDEAHLHVELIELAGQPVGARVLVAEAGRDLEVAVEAGHHDELLELLRRLRQRVEFSRMNARRHQEVARALRRRSRQDGRGELVEAGAVHQLAHLGDDGGAPHDVGVQRLAPEIEEAVFEAYVLRIFGLAEHRHRQLGRLRQHLDLTRKNLDMAGRQVGVHRFRRARLHLAVDADAPFGAHHFGQLEGRRIGVGDHLRQAVMVPEVDEQQPAVIADAVHPAREADGRPHILGAKRAAGMAAIAVHDAADSNQRASGNGRKSAEAPKCVKPAPRGPRCFAAYQCRAFGSDRPRRILL